MGAPRVRGASTPQPALQTARQECRVASRVTSGLSTAVTRPVRGRALSPTRTVWNTGGLPGHAVPCADDVSAATETGKVRDNPASWAGAGRRETVLRAAPGAPERRRVPHPRARSDHLGAAGWGPQGQEPQSGGSGVWPREGTGCPHALPWRPAGARVAGKTWGPGWRNHDFPSISKTGSEPRPPPEPAPPPAACGLLGTFAPAQEAATRPGPSPPSTLHPPPARAAWAEGARGAPRRHSHLPRRRRRSG